MKQQLCSAILVAFSIGFVAMAQPIESATAQKKTEAKTPIVVSGAVLAQAVQDDVSAAAKMYHLTELQVDGVIAGQSEFKERIAMLRLDFMVKDPKTKKMTDFSIFCSLKEPLAKGDKRLDELAVGKKVTVRGTSTAMGNGQVTLTGCLIVPKKTNAKY
ncbi:MAG TPA: hypothetical protein VFE62_25505 [Gemmataceae bacterium]|nr:hypothetical protein [Gemmataceae bacterium]